MCASAEAGYRRAMVLRPFRRAPMMLGGVGFQVGLDEAQHKQMQAQRQAAAAAAPRPDVVTQLKELKALLDDGVLTPEELPEGQDQGAEELRLAGPRGTAAGTGDDCRLRRGRRQGERDPLAVATREPACRWR